MNQLVIFLQVAPAASTHCDLTGFGTAPTGRRLEVLCFTMWPTSSGSGDGNDYRRVVGGGFGRKASEPCWLLYVWAAGSLWHHLVTWPSSFWSSSSSWWSCSSPLHFSQVIAAGGLIAGVTEIGPCKKQRVQGFSDEVLVLNSPTPGSNHMALAALM